MSRTFVPPDHTDSPLAVQKSVSKKHRSPWLVVFAGGIISLVVVLVLGLLLNLISDDVVLPEFEYQATMPDGTLLVVEAVSWGTSHNAKLRGMPQSGLFSRYVNQVVSQTTSSDRLVVFMRRLDPRTGRPLDFTWWGSSSAVDVYGSEISDTNPYQHVLYRYGSSSSGGRPLSPPGDYGYFDPRDPSSAVVAYSEFPAFRVEGDTFHLLVKNLAGEVVGEFDLPYKGTRTTDVWTPDPLPAVQTDKGLTVTLSGVNATVDDSSTYNGVVQYRYYLSADAQFAYNGMPATDWYFNRTWFEDPLGNSAENYNLNLSWGEPAWKMHATAWPYDWNTIPIKPGESAEIGTFTLPESGVSAPISASASASGKSLNWSWIGGHQVTYNLGRGAGYSTSWSTSVYVDGNYINLELEEDYSSPRILTVGGDVYTIVGIDPGYASGAYTPYNLEVRITTPDGVAIPSNSTTMSDLLVTAFIPPEGVTEVTATLVVRMLPEFEFLIAPPEQPPMPTQAVPGEPIPIAVPTAETQPEQMTLPEGSPTSETPIPEPPPM